MAIIIDRVLASRGQWTPGPDDRVEELRMGRAEAERGFGTMTTNGGTAVVLRLPRGTVLADGDLVYREEGLLMAVAISYPPSVEIVLPEGEDGEARTRYALSLGHFLGNQHYPMRVVSARAVRVPVDDPAPLLALLQRSAFADIVARVVPGSEEDPLPNPQAHGA